MSWFEQNYEKAAIGGAAVAALGLAFFGWSKVGGVPNDFPDPPKGEGNNAPEVQGADLVTKATSSRARDLSWVQGAVDERQVDLFTGIPLFIPRDKPDTAIDLLKSDPVHSPIPNKWWIEYRLDPGFADSPQQDKDGDGYNNLEEFTAKTSPIDKASHPSLLDKLKYETDESLQWGLRPGFPEGGDGTTFKFLDAKGGKNKNELGKVVKPGDIFFAEEPMKGRFKFLGLEKRKQRNERLHIDEEITLARIEDLKPNKAGTVYEIPAPLSEARINEFAQFDRSAVMTLEAAGEEGKRQTIPENTKFGLPFNNPQKDYLLKKVTPEKVEVEHTDPKTGTKSSVTINKGSFPTKNP